MVSHITLLNRERDGGFVLYLPALNRVGGKC